MTTGTATPGTPPSPGTDPRSAPGGADPVAAITEHEAQGEVADYYADIRETLGVPVVNLVWRHLATIEGALPWAWQAVRPAYVSGAVGQAADRLRKQMHLPVLPAIPEAVFVSLGLSTADLNGIQSVLRSYDRSNPMNWLALSALLRAAQPAPERRPASTDALAGDRPDEGGSAQSASGQPGGNGRPSNSAPPLALLPPLPALATLDAHTARLVLHLDTLGNDHPRPILASMYRHLSYWPAYLAMLWLQCSDRGAPDRLTQARDEVVRRGEPLIMSLASQLRLSAHPPAPVQGLNALRDFIDRIGLPRMIAITGMAKATLDGHEASNARPCPASPAPSAAGFGEPACEPQARVAYR